MDEFYLLYTERMWEFIVLAGACGIALGYAIFYWRYQHRDVVSELRKNLKSANEQIVYLQDELEELQAQNTLFREKTTELLEKNDELSDVVAELGKYYVHIKKASEKTAELSKYLHEPDADMEGKLWSFADQERGNNKKSFF